MNVTTRKLAAIQLNSPYLRLDTDVSTLKRSIASLGLLHPLTINPADELIAGARRFQAVRELGWEEVPVQVIDRDALAQELVSIDENLVRVPLTSLELEQSLNRGRELYEQLNPAAHKVDLSAADLSPEERLAKKQRDEQDHDSFAAVTAEKTGLSRAVIQGAIKRDELAAEAVKQARGEGRLDATRTNEIIKLDADVQAGVLPLITDKTAKEARRIVAAAQEGGLDAARAEAETVVPMPREYRQILSPVKKVNRTIAKILLEDLQYDGPEREAIHGELMKLWDHLEAYFSRAGLLADEEADEGGAQPSVPDGPALEAVDDAEPTRADAPDDADGDEAQGLSGGAAG